jgi:hypothetical protein
MADGGFMSILLSGDFHANSVNELSSITKNALIEKYRQEIYSGIKYHIILGDGGFMWPGNHKTDLFNYKVLAYRPFPVLCVIGNHEPMLGMKDLAEADIGIGETVYQIHDNPFVAYLKRGKVYVIDGIKFLVLGGALSIDKSRRTPNKTWWEGEYWDKQEEADLFALLESENIFDCVISHTGPHHINEAMFKYADTYYDKSFDEVALLNDEVHNEIQFREWWCGHWHKDKYYYDEKSNRAYQYLYRTTKILDKADNGFTVHNEYGMERQPS